MKTKTLVVKTKIVNVTGYAPKIKTVNTHITVSLVENKKDILKLMDTNEAHIIKCINDRLTLIAATHERLKVITQKEIYL